MNRILQLAPRGLVRTGLVCAYDFSKRNLLRYSEAFDNAAWDKTTFPVSVDTDVKTVNGVSLDRISASGGSAGHKAMQVNASAVAGKVYTMFVLIEKDAADYALIHDRGDADHHWAAFDLVNGTVTGSASATGKITAQDTAYLCAITFTRTNAGQFQACVGPLPAGNTGLSSYAPAATPESILAGGAQINEGTYPLTYEATTDNQTLVDRWKYGYNGQLGSVAGADVNDPTWGGIGLTYGADDYVKIAAAANINNLSQITIMSAFRLDGWGGGGGGRISEKGQREVYTTVSYAAYFRDFDGAANGVWRTPLDSLAVGTAYTLAVTHDATSAANDPAMYLQGRSVTVTEVTTPLGSVVADAASNLTLGNSSAATRNFDGPMGYYLEYNRILTPAEIMRNHNYLKAEMARRGLSIA